MKSKKNSIWGLSLTLTILSIFSIALSIVGIVYLIIAFTYTSDTTTLQSIASKIDIGYGSSLQNGAINIGGESTSLAELLSRGLIFIMILIIISLIANTISLIASIYGLKNYSKKSKQKYSFGLGISGAIASAINFRFISLVLFIIYSSKVHRYRFSEDADLRLGKHAK